MKDNPFVLYRPMSSVNDVPLSLRSVGFANLAKGSGTEKGRILEFIQLIWSEAGRGVIEFTNCRFELSEGEVLAIMPGRKHCLTALSSSWQIHWVTIDGLYAADIAAKMCLDQGKINVGTWPADRFEEMTQLVTRADRTAVFEASSRCYQLLTQLAASGNGQVDKVDDALALIRANAGNRDVGIAQIAEQLGMERTLFSKQVSAAAGMSPKEYLDACRLEKVMYRLANTGESVAEIADKTGFANGNYLAKFFRKKTGMSPLVFRQQAAGL